MNAQGYGRDHMEKHYAAAGATTASGAMSDSLNSPLMVQPLRTSPALSKNVYSTSQTSWDAQELHLLHKGLTQFPSERYDNITRCIKIAATIPDKSIRDVAFKIRSINISHEKNKMQESASSPQQMSMAMLQHQHHQQQQHQQHQHQLQQTQHAYQSQQQNQQNQHHQQQQHQQHHQPHHHQQHQQHQQQQQSAYHMPQQLQQQLKRQKVDNNDILEPLVPLTIKKESVSPEDVVKKALQDNAKVLENFRGNLAAGQLRNNLPLMAHFRDTVQVILKKMSAICTAVPPLPVELDLSLLSPSSADPSPPPSRGNNQDDIV
ncbi:Aste57867_21912 [Aphanomyces stellatus]|uniref:Aste57867_21912 protein n=1 Tax=Aphanomyces stellatus TaxID=120398 RepID=A0A485LJG1_9STRA|nr:hypothetical protein As57867_021843 [Aphanomyces stellatus]VFT98580.1 Aste57867_21912 [Aphanomyces stellatus]